VQRSGAGASGYVSAMLRLGSVPYLVGRPLDLGLEADEGVRYERRVPARLVQGLRGGELDVALVSAIELFRQPGARPVRGLAVAGRGEVDSVQVFLRRPLDQVRRLALDPSSRAAAALVQVLLAERDGGPPEYLEVPLGTDPREADADAWLRIGDRALEETWLEGLDHWNPSEAWTRSTGLPFVFATWLVTEGAAVGPHLASLHAAAERGVAARRALAEEAAPVLGLPAKDLTRYLVEQCVFTLGDEMGDALRLYGERARALGLASQGLGRFLEAPDGAPCRG
jgi:chorismate dehydratase